MFKMKKVLLFLAISCFFVSKSWCCLSSNNQRNFKKLVIPEAKQEMLNKTLKGESGSILSMVVLLNGDLATGTKTNAIQIWDTVEGSLLRSYLAHDGPINALAALQDGNLASASDDKTIKIWTTIDGNEIQELKEHTGNVTCLGVLPTGLLVSGSLDGIIIIWNNDFLIEKKIIVSNQIKSLLVLDKDHLVIKTTSNNQVDSVILIWNIKTNSEIQRFTEQISTGNPLVLLPNSYFASGSNNTITIRNKNIPSLNILIGHSDVVNCLALLPSGYLASGSSDKTIRIWSLSDWKLIKIIETKSEVLSFSVLSNGYLASGLNDETIKIWNVEQKDLTVENDKKKTHHNSLNNHTSKVNSLVVLANGLLASASDDSTIKIWDPIDGILAYELIGHKKSVKCLSLLPNGFLVSGSADATIKVWDVSEYKIINTFYEDREITSLVTLKNGTLLYRLDNGTIKEIDTKDGTIKNTIHKFPQNIISFNSLAILKNEYIAIEENTSFNITILTPNGTLFKKLNGHTKTVNSLEIHHNGLLISGSNDKTIKVWNISTGTMATPSLNINSEIYALKVLPNGNIAAGTKDVIIIIDGNTWTTIKTLNGHTDRVNTLAVLPSGYLASGSNDKNEIMIWSLHNDLAGTVVPIQFKIDKSVKYNQFVNHSSTVLSYVLLYNGDIASGSKDTKINIWDPQTDQLKSKLNGHTGWVWVLVSLPNGYFASGSADTTIKIWDLKYKENNTLKGHQRSVRALSVLPNGNLVSGSEDFTIKIWNFYKGTLIKTLEKHTGTILCLISFPNGYLASGSSDETVNIWNTENGNLIKTLKRHKSAITALAILRNGNLSTASADSMINIWNISIDTGNIISFKAYGPIYSLTALANGDLVSGSSNGHIEFWNSYDGVQIKYLSEGEDNFVSSLLSMDNNDLFYGLNDGNFKILTAKISISELTIYANFSFERHLSDIRSLTKLGISYVVSAAGDGEIKVWDFLDLKDPKERNTIPSVASMPVLSVIELDYNKILATSNDTFIMYTFDFNSKPISYKSDKIKSFHSDLIYFLLILKNNFVLSASADRTIKVWNSSDFKELITLRGHVEAVKCLAELPNNQIASGSEDHNIKIWDLSSLQNPKEVKTLEGHTYWIRCLVYLEHQNYLASGSWDRYIFIWDLSDFTLKMTLEALDTVYSFGILKNGDLVSGSANGYVQIWNRTSLTEIKSVYRDAAAIWSFALLPKGHLAIGLANGKIDILKMIY